MTEPDPRRRSRASDYPGTEVTLRDLLEAGVPWFLAKEAIASTALDRDERVRTYSARDTDKYLDER